MVRGDIAGDEFVVFQVGIGHGDDGESIVHEMGEYRYPDIFAPIKQIAEICAQQHAGKEAEKALNRNAALQITR